jgi:Zn-dependent M28 family amino/carboxypeptidase
MLELARILGEEGHARTLRFVGFVNEELPHFQTEDMGSLQYARMCDRRGDRIEAMFSLETVGYYAEEPGTQRYPFPYGLFYPDTGDFIAFVGNMRSRSLVRRSIRTFRENATLPSEGAAAIGWLPGIGLSDHWSFWKQGVPAVMITDTAMFRYPWYHTGLDRPKRLDYERMARLVSGLAPVIRELAR